MELIIELTGISGVPAVRIIFNSVRFMSGLGPGDVGTGLAFPARLRINI